MREINLIVVHCADTPSTMDVGVKEIREWHVKDNGWDDIGYHFVIRRSGTIEDGRPILVPGAHVAGHNKNSIGICLVGGKSGKPLFTKEQFVALKMMLINLKQIFAHAEIKGHYELDDKKTCPNFNVQEWLDEENI